MPDLVARHVDDRRVDRRDDALYKAEKLAKRPVVVGKVPLEGEVGAIELQQEPVPDDRLIFDLKGRADCGQIGLLAVVIFVFHRADDDAGRRRGQKRLDKRIGFPIESDPEIATLRLHRIGIEIFDLPDRLRWVHVRYRLAARQHLAHLRLQQRITLDIAARPPRPTRTEPAHPALDVEKERLALLLAVIADIDARGGLFVDDLG